MVTDKATQAFHRMNFHSPFWLLRLRLRLRFRFLFRFWFRFYFGFSFAGATGEPKATAKIES